MEEAAAEEAAEAVNNDTTKEKEIRSKNSGRFVIGAVEEIQSVVILWLQ